MYSPATSLFCSLPLAFDRLYCSSDERVARGIIVTAIARAFAIYIARVYNPLVHFAHSVFVKSLAIRDG
jgi:hypothetical protein